MSKKKQTKVFGMRNSGTNYLQALIAENFDVDPLGVYQYGWKHSIPEVSFWKNAKVHFSNVKFFIIYRDLLPWLISIKRNTHQSKALKAKAVNANMVEFMTSEFDGYANPVEMYLTKMQDISRATRAHEGGVLLIRYDALIQKPEAHVEAIGKFLNLPLRGEFTDIDDYFTSGKRTKKKYDRSVNSPSYYADQLGPDAVRILRKMTT